MLISAVMKSSCLRPLCLLWWVGAASGVQLYTKHQFSWNWFVSRLAVTSTSAAVSVQLTNLYLGWAFIDTVCISGQNWFCANFKINFLDVRFELRSHPMWSEKSSAKVFCMSTVYDLENKWIWLWLKSKIIVTRQIESDRTFCDRIEFIEYM